MISTEIGELFRFLIAILLRKKLKALVVGATRAFCLSAETSLPIDVTTVVVRSGSTAAPLKRPDTFVASPFLSLLKGFPGPARPCVRAFLQLRKPASFSPGTKNPRRPKEGQRGFLSNKEPDRDYSSNVPFTMISPSRII